MTVSIICGVHCATIPILMLILPLTDAVLEINAWIEWGVIGSTIVIGTWALTAGFKRHHRALMWTLFLVGVAIILSGKLLVEEDLEPWLVVTGAGFLVAAHFNNLRACRIPGHRHST